MGKRSKGRPEPVMRFFVSGAEVTPAVFWESVAAFGGALPATVTAEEEAAEPGYRLTPKGRLALVQGTGA